MAYTCRGLMHNLDHYLREYAPLHKTDDLKPQGPQETILCQFAFLHPEMHDSL